MALLGAEAGRGHAAMLAFSALVAGSFALGTRAANLLDPAALNAVRFWIAAAIIGGVLLARGWPRDWGGLWRYPVLGGLFAIYFVLMFEGLKTAPSVSAAAVFTLTPLMAAGFGRVLLGQRMTSRIAVALALGALGALWVIFRGSPAALLRFEVGRGEAIYFLGCVAHALYTPMVRRLNQGESAIQFTFGMLVAGAVILTAWGWPALTRTDWSRLPAIVWVTIAYTSVFASAATFVLLQFASLRLPSAKVMAYTYLTPAWVIGWEVALGGAVPAPVTALGVILTLTALVLLLRDEEPRADGSR